MSYPVYFAKNIWPLIDNPNKDNKRQLISCDPIKESFEALSAEAQDDILSTLPRPDFEIALNHESNDSIMHYCDINSNHDDNVKALIEISELSTFNHNEERRYAEANWFKLCAKIDAINTSGNSFLKFKKRNVLQRDGFTAGEKAFVLCHMKAWNIQICHFIEYTASMLKISKFEFNEAEYQKIVNYLDKFTQVLGRSLVGQIPPQGRFQNRE